LKVKGLEGFGREQKWGKRGEKVVKAGGRWRKVEEGRRKVLEGE
jgi:hypothetical protein